MAQMVPADLDGSEKGEWVIVARSTSAEEYGIKGTGGGQRSSRDLVSQKEKKVSGTIVSGSPAGRLRQAWFDGRGCVISQAAASILCEHIEGKNIQQLREFTALQMLELLEIQLTLRGLECELLSEKKGWGCLSPITAAVTGFRNFQASVTALGGNIIGPVKTDHQVTTVSWI